jgi:tetratricopeptide (TPR) repeat protein
VLRGAKVDEYFFVSYSTVDATEFVLMLADDLAAGPPSYPVWVDKRSLRPGEDWDEQVVEALRTCRGLLFVLTRDSAGPDSGCKQEWVRALKYKKPVIPLRLHPDAELPFRLGSREFIDFSGGYSGALAQLRKHLAWTSTPAGVLHELRTLLSDAHRELPRVVPERRPVIEGEIAELNRRIAAQRQLMEHPVQAQRQTRQRIERELERQRQPERPAIRTSSVSRARFVNPPPMIAPVYFQDREVETALVTEYLRTPGLRMTTVVGRGGVGKTALVCRLLSAIETGRLPERVGDLVVEGIVYLSPVGAHPVSFPNLFEDVCRLLPDADAERLRQLYRDPQQSTRTLMLALLEAFPDGRSVVLLDNVEDIIDAGTGAITDSALEEALHALLSAPEHGVRVVITTRVAPRELLLTQPATQRRLNLDEGLASPYAENILRAMDPDGSLGLRDAPEVLLTRARERTRGYPRALEALAAILAADRDTTLSELLTETERLPDNVVHALVGEAFSRLDPLAQQVMQALAVYPVPVPPVAVDYLVQPYRAAINTAPVLTRLVNMNFLRRDAERYYLHQLDRDYALAKIPSGDPSDRDADPPPWTQHALRHRAASYFTQTRAPRETWKTLNDLAPHLAEFELRVHNTDYDAAVKVLRGIDFDYLMPWGHYRFTIDLHQRLHGHLTNPRTNSGHLNVLGLCYALLGQISTARDHYQQALAIDREIGNREGEAAVLGNLSHCDATLGQISTALDHCQQALTIDREIGNRKGEATQLATLGNCYLRLGQINIAQDHCQQALAIFREIGNRGGEAAVLGNLSLCDETLGQISTARDHYQQALAIHREIGNRKGEANQLVNLGNCDVRLGQTSTALEHYQQALAIFREIGNREGEAMVLGNLGIRDATLGQISTAQDHCQQALTIYREIGNRAGEVNQLGNLGDCDADLGQFPSAIEKYLIAIEIADEIGAAQTRCEARVSLAQAHLYMGDVEACHTTATNALAYDYPPARAQAHLLLGIAQLIRGEYLLAQQCFTTTVRHADAQLQHSTENYANIECKALALCGLVLTGQPDQLPEAISMFEAARAITTAPGAIARTLRLFDAISTKDLSHLLTTARSAAQGKPDPI